MTDQVDAVTNDAPEVNPVEQQARAGGWVPKEDYQGDEHKWVDAGEFVRRGPLFEKINDTTREVKELRKALDQLKQHHLAVKEVAFKDALAALKAQKKEAFNEGDPDKIIEIDDKIDALKADQTQLQIQQAREAQAAAQSVVPPEFQEWSNRNSWYNTSKPMRAFADALGVELHSGGMSPSEVLKKVEAQVKAEFPHKFQNPNREKAASVEGTSKGSGKSGSSSRDDLTADERRVMDRFIRTGVMDEATYRAELKKTKEA